MPPNFHFRTLNFEARALDDGGRTVAIVTKRGSVDWLLAGAADAGPRIASIFKETHLGYVLGLKFDLHFPGLTSTYDPVRKEFEPLQCEILEGGAQAAVSVASRSADGNWRGLHRAVMHLSPATGRYEWALETRLTCCAAKPTALNWIEYNNVIPANTGLCFLHAELKRYNRTLMVDRDGTVWNFPHQHLMHYSAARKIQPLRFARGALAGFFGEAMNPKALTAHEKRECAIEGLLRAARLARRQNEQSAGDRLEKAADLAREHHQAMVLALGEWDELSRRDNALTIEAAVIGKKIHKLLGFDSVEEATGWALQHLPLTNARRAAAAISNEMSVFAKSANKQESQFWVLVGNAARLATSDDSNKAIETIIGMGA